MVSAESRTLPILSGAKCPRRWPEFCLLAAPDSLEGPERELDGVGRLRDAAPVHGLLGTEVEEDAQVDGQRRSATATELSLRSSLSRSVS